MRNGYRVENGSADPVNPPIQHPHSQINEELTSQVRFPYLPPVQEYPWTLMTVHNTQPSAHPRQHLSQPLHALSQANES